MITELRQTAQMKDLILAWTGRTIRGRYQQSLLGWFWAIVQPLASVALFTIIFTRFVPVDTGDTPYVVFSYVALVPWTLFASAVTEMADSLVQNMNLVTKIYFPREALAIATMLARLVDFLVAGSLLVILILYYGLPLYLPALLFLPVILSVQLALILGLGLGLAALNVFFRDVQPFLKLAIQLWFYASPIIYPVDMVDETLRPFYFLNPMAGILEGYRDVLIKGQLPGDYLGLSALISFSILLAGYWFFKRVEPQFADIV